LMAGRSKYGNKRVVIGGRKFDSQSEAFRYEELVHQERAGEISELRCQVPFVLAPSVLVRGASRKTPELRYFADFVYVDKNGQTVIEDVKGAITEAYRIKRHLLAVQGIHITEIRE
jgi:hypothetical protein